ncbi:Transposase [Shigella dysenteriae 1617]|uniref:Transposase n=1 Tax=Shigella dysenteriae 1617 TaxID=754093 RepID=A0A0A7A4T1_SHIDY|nr:Transposase [Shigella dysenteriae 1617]
MKVNCDHETTLKASIIPLIQLIGGITGCYTRTRASVAAKSVMAFRVLTMAVDLCRLTTRTMNVNAGHERTSKARIIHQIQLIRGITAYREPRRH